MRKDNDEYYAAFPENPRFLSDISESVFLNVFGAQESIPRNNSASLCSLSGRYDNPIPTPFLAPIDCLKIPALVWFGQKSLLHPYVCKGKSYTFQTLIPMCPFFSCLFVFVSVYAQ